ncbi:MAG: hypothetical protein SFW35_12045 [Chitinophagales bacterium]|nr:hypothetical protein [Chitinophagales bacterium]
MNATSTKPILLNWLRELLWWLAAAIIIAIVLLPLVGTIKNELLLHTALFSLVAITLFRYTVFLNQVPYLRHLYARVALIVVVAVGIFQFVRQLQNFMYIADNYTISSFLKDERMYEHADAITQTFLYFKQLHLLALVSILMLSVILILRTIASLRTIGRDYDFSKNRPAKTLPEEELG